MNRSKLLAQLLGLVALSVVLQAGSCSESDIPTPPAIDTAPLPPTIEDPRPPAEWTSETSWS